MKDIKDLVLNNSDLWTGKTNEDLIVEKINEIIKYLKEIKKLLTINK